MNAQLSIIYYLNTTSFFIESRFDFIDCDLISDTAMNWPERKLKARLIFFLALASIGFVQGE